MEDGSGTDTGVEGAGTAGIEGAGPRTDEHFFGWFPLGSQPLVLLGTAHAKPPDSPTIAAPSTIEPIRPIRVFILLPPFEFEH
jgi:hypothetical protein